MAVLATIAMAFAAEALFVQLASIALVLVRLGARRPPVAPPEPAPRITVLRPAHGLEHALEQTLASGLELDYPNYEMLFCVEDETDPAVPLIRRLIATHPATDARLLIGRDTVSDNPKLNNLMKGWRAATGDWVAMADSNIVLPRDYLSHLLSRWDRRTGLVSAPAEGVAPETWAGGLECAFLNTYQARWQVAADQLGLGYAQGKTLFWKRSFLEAAGGPKVLGGDVAEDAAATKVVRAAGLRVRLARRPFPHPVGRRSLGAVWARQVRWAKIRRLEFPGLFLAEPLTGALLPLVALATASHLLGLPGWGVLGYAVLWYGAEWGLARRAGWPSGPKDIATMMVRDALLPPLWLAAWRGNGFVWQGNRVSAAPGATKEEGVKHP